MFENSILSPGFQFLEESLPYLESKEKKFLNKITKCRIGYIFRFGSLCITEKIPFKLMNHRLHKLNIFSALVSSTAQLEKVMYQRCLIQTQITVMGFIAVLFLK